MALTQNEIVALARILDEREREKERERITARIARNPKPKRVRSGSARKLRLVIVHAPLVAPGFDAVSMQRHRDWLAPKVDVELAVDARTNVLHGEWAEWLTEHCDCRNPSQHDCAWRYEQPDYCELHRRICNANAKVGPWYLRLASYNGERVQV